MKNCHEIIDNPESENIKFFLKKIKRTTLQDETFFFFLLSYLEIRKNCVQGLLYFVLLLMLVDS